jgi:uncharacterized protein (TIGR02271 family)
MFKIEAVAAVIGAALLASGCRSTNEAAYSSEPAPAVSAYSSAGAPGASYETQGGAATSGANMVIPLQKEQVNVGAQQVDQGSVRIKKIVKTETVNTPVTLRTESVSVERVPTSQAPQATGGSLGAPFQEGETVINLSKEQPFVSTQVVPAGSVVVKKQVNMQNVNIQRQVRSEDVAAVPSGNLENIHISGNVPTSGNEAQGAPPANYNEQSGGGGQPITSLDQFTTGSPAPGQQVNLGEVEVQKIVGPNLVAVGPVSQPVYCHVNEPISGLKVGDKVTVTGVVQQAPSNPSSLGLDEQSYQALQGQKVIIHATNISRSGQ